ncbi:MAG: hypothetical protein ACPGSD_12305 [Flavobacteriales bacterium]
MKQQNLLLLFIMQVLFGCSSELIDANGKILQKYSTNNIVCEIDTIEKEMDIRFYEDSNHTGFFTVFDFNLERKLVGVKVNYPNFTKYFNYYPRRKEYDVRIKFGRKKRLQQLLIFDENLKLIEDYGIYIKRFNLQGANYFQLKMTNVLLDSLYVKTLGKEYSSSLNSDQKPIVKVKELGERLFITYKTKLDSMNLYREGHIYYDTINGYFNFKDQETLNDLHFLINNDGLPFDSKQLMDFDTIYMQNEKYGIQLRLQGDNQ